jgi:uncharacterized protein (TIGR03435 family)
MLQADDMALLRQYASSHSEEAFATLVSRHINLVYSVASRHVAGPHLAEEISQAVFMILARKAGSLRDGTVLSGWLYHTARLTAANYVRSEIRRAQREQEAMQSFLNEPEPDTWAQVAPFLDQAMSGLNESDRNAVVLRFFESKSFQEVGASLGTTEEAAKMRVNRAVEKLRKLLVQRGVALSASVLCGSLAVHSVQAAPVGLAAAVTASVLQGSTASASLLTLIKGTLKVMAWTKAKTTAAVAVGVLFVTGTATVTVKEMLDHRAYPWQVQNLSTDILKQVPPQVRIVPSRFPESGGSCAVNGMVLGIGQSAESMLLAAYDGSSSRLIRTTALPEKKYDFIANLPHDSRQALQNEIKRKLGLIAHHEMRLTNVLQLKVKKAGADGLRPSDGQGGSARSSAGQFSCVNQSLSCLAGMLESSLKQPVVDHTGLTGNFDIDLFWDAPDYQHQNPDNLKQAMLDELGLELIPANEPIDMLIVERAN